MNRMRRVEPRSTFDEAAELYAEVRPGLSGEVVDEIVRHAGLPPDGRILEVGVGTGQATLPFAERDYAVLGLELGESLAAVAARTLRAYPKVQVRHTAFEDWPPEPAGFDLVLSVQAFHWIEPGFGLDRAAEVLRPSGSMALLWHLDRSSDTPFYRATNPVYARYFAGMPEGRSLPGWVEVYRQALERHPRFGHVTELRVDWEQVYSKDAYLKLLATFSDHRSLDETARTRFSEEIAGVIDRFGGSVTRLYTTVLLLAGRA